MSPHEGARESPRGVRHWPVWRLADVDDRHAIDEGEGYANAAAFRVSHERYWRESGSVDRVRAYLADPSWDLDDDTLVVA